SSVAVCGGPAAAGAIVRCSRRDPKLRHRLSLLRGVGLVHNATGFVAAAYCLSLQWRRNRGLQYLLSAGGRDLDAGVARPGTLAVRDCVVDRLEHGSKLGDTGISPDRGRL